MADIRVYDLFDSGAVADADLTGRVTTSGHAWAQFAAGYAAGLRLSYQDSGTTRPPKSVNNVVDQLPRMNYIASAMLFPTLSARGRHWTSNTASATDSFLGLGFVDADGNGYFGGIKKNAGPVNGAAICRANRAAGTMDILASWVSNVPWVVPLVRLMELRYIRHTGTLDFYFGGTLRASVVDATYAPLLPAVVSHALGAGTASRSFIAELLFEGIGEEIIVSNQLDWRPLGAGHWRAEAVFDFSAATSYEFSVEGYVTLTTVRARAIAFQAYAAGAAVTITMDGLPITLQAGNELIAEAPANPIVRVAGSIGQLRVRCYTSPYGLYQRN